jgi:hypothetical protein
MTDGEIVLTAPEAAALLKISLSAAYSYAQRGILPAFKVAGNVRFLKSDVLARIDELRMKARGGKALKAAFVVLALAFLYNGAALYLYQDAQGYHVTISEVC